MTPEPKIRSPTNRHRKSMLQESNNLLKTFQMKSPKLLFLLIFCMLCKISWAQNDANEKVRNDVALNNATYSINEQSDDNSSSIARTGPSPETNFSIRDIDIGADKYTGIANIKVPIYSIEIGKDRIPISLYYNASGIRADDAASIVGLGWRLNAGGKITRAIRGRYDNPEQLSHTGNMQEWNVPNLNKWLVEEWDTQPDQYYFELPNLAGSFVLDTLGTGYPIPYQNIKIEFKNNRFKIYDEHGTCYHFATSDTTEERYDKNPPRQIPCYASPWYLDKIEYLNGETMDFYYQTDSTSITKYSSHIRGVQFNNNSDKSGYDSTIRYIKFDEISTSIANLYPHYLNKIIYKDQLIEFVYSRENSDVYRGRKLTDIIVKHVKGKEEKQVRRFEFLYERFAHNRLKLSALREREPEPEPEQAQAYRPICNFEYYEDVTPPQRNSPGIDHWGYFRAAMDINVQNANLIFPAVKLTSDIDSSFPKQGVEVFGLDRKPNLQYTRVQSLKKIIYPNGGSTELIYELHHGFNKLENKNTDAGGLRIQQIIKRSSSTDLPMIHKYEYEGGIIYDDQQNYILSQKKFENPTGYYLRFFYSNKNQGSPIDYYGASVVYSAVKEILPNGSFIKYSYLPYDKYPDVSPVQYNVGNGVMQFIGVEKIGLTPKTSRSWWRRLLRSKVSYNAKNQIIDSTTYQYVQLGTRSIVGYTIQDSHINYENPANNKYRICRYTILSIPVCLSSEIIHKGKYNLPAQITYKYDNASWLLTQKTRTDFFGTTTQTTYTYPQDFAITDTTSVVGKLIQRNAIVPLEEITTRNGKIIAAQGRSYRFNGTNKNAVVLDCERSLRKATPIDPSTFTPVRCTTSGITFNNLYQLDKNYLDYNSSGQLLCYRDEAGVDHSFVYRNTTRPIATILNARHSENPAYNQVYYNDFEDDPSSDSGVSARSGDKARLVYSGTSFTIDRKFAPGSYILTYHTEGEWNAVKTPVEIANSNTSPAINFGRYFGYIDDIIMLPRNATISTSCYVPGWGNVSETTEQGLYFKTEYNGFGLPVKITDHRNITIKQFDYK